MTYEEVEEYYGSGYRISKNAGFSAGAPYNWKRQGFIPIDSQVLIEKRTGGLLRASLDHCKEESAHDINGDRA